MVFQTLIYKNFRDKEIHHYPSQQGCCYFRISSEFPALLYIYLPGDSLPPMIWNP